MQEQECCFFAFGIVVVLITACSFEVQNLAVEVDILHEMNCMQDNVNFFVVNDCY